MLEFDTVACFLKDQCLGSVSSVQGTVTCNQSTEACQDTRCAQYTSSTTCVLRRVLEKHLYQKARFCLAFGQHCDSDHLGLLHDHCLCPCLCHPCCGGHGHPCLRHRSCCQRI